MIHPEKSTPLFLPSPNPMEEICTILARGYLRLLVVREKEKGVVPDEERKAAAVRDNERYPSE